MIIQLFIEDVEIDLSEEYPVPLNFQVSDITDLASRKSSFSKTVKVPNTKINQLAFASLFDLKVENTEDNTQRNINYYFNPKRKADFTLLRNSQVILQGYVKLYNITNENGKINYDLILYSDFANIIVEMGDKRLEDLSMPELEHTLTIGNITGSWTHNEPWIYPIIDYGVIDSRGKSFNTDSLRPAVYAKYYLDKIFEETNFTYSSSFFDSEIFSKLIIPFNRDKLGGIAGGLSTRVAQSGSIFSGPYTSISGSEELYDTVLVGDNYDTTDKEYTIVTSGSYNFRAGLDYEIIIEEQPYDPNNPFDVPVGALSLKNTTITLQMKVFDASDVEKTALRRETTLDFNSIFNLVGVVNLLAINVSLEENDKVKFYVNIVSDGVVDGNGTNFGTVSFILNGRETTARMQPVSLLDGRDLEANDFILKDITQKDYFLSIVKLFNLYVVPDKNIPRHLNIFTRDEYYSSEVQKDWTDKLVRNELIEITPAIDIDAKQFRFTYKPDTDYFNKLYTDTYGQIYGEKRVDTGYEFSPNIKDVVSDTIFSPTVPINYATGSEQGETLVEALSGSEYIIDGNQIINVQGYYDITDGFSKGDPAKDYPTFNTTHIGRKISILGEEYKIVNFISPYQFQISGSIRVTTSGAGSLTPAKVLNNETFLYINDDNKIFPAIYSSDDNNVTRKPVASQPRILYYDSLFGCETYSITQTGILREISNADNSQTIKEYEYPTYYTSSNFAVEVGVYPFISHLDDPENPTLDLLFGRPQQLYWENQSIDTNYSDESLYDFYYKNAVEEAIDKNNRLLTAYFLLDETDISTLELNDIIWIDGSQFYINKIQDFDASTTDITKVELFTKKKKFELNS